jgi:hypothetical protein
MRFLPDDPARRAQTITRDVLTVLALAALAWLALEVHDRVAALGAAGRGAQEAGRAVQAGFGEAAGAVGGAPVVGGSLADALRDAGAGTGGTAVEAGRDGEAAAEDAATVLGWLTFLLPGGLLLLRVVPARVAQVRGLTAAARVLALDRAGTDPEHARLLARRAVFALPCATLLRHTADPFGDLRAGRHGPLLAAMAEDAGLRPPPAAPGDRA